MPEVTFPAIEDLLPHRTPMILIDRIVEAGETSVVSEVSIHAGAQFCGAAGVPSFVGIEYMAQTVAAFSGLQNRRAALPVQIGFLLGSPRFNSSCSAFPLGQTLRVEVTHVWGESELLRFACSIKEASSGMLLQQADLSVFRPANLGTLLLELEV